MLKVKHAAPSGERKLHHPSKSVQQRQQVVSILLNVSLLKINTFKYAILPWAPNGPLAAYWRDARITGAYGECSHRYKQLTYFTFSLKGLGYQDLVLTACHTSPAGFVGLFINGCRSQGEPDASLFRCQ